MSHSPEPWEVTQDPIESRCSAIKARFEYEPGEFASIWIAREVKLEDAERIVACANACRHIPTEVLKGGLKAFGGHLQDLVHDLNQSNNPEVAKIAANLSSLSSVIADRFQEEQNGHEAS